MAHRGICSRRQAEELIQKGWVMVKGHPVAIGEKFAPDVAIDLNPQARKWLQSKITIILNKPLGYVSNLPEKEHKEAKELITVENFFASGGHPSKTNHPPLVGLSCAGRLDINSTGLLVMTQDGTIAKKIISPDSRVEKEYLVRIQGIVTEEKLKQLRYGLTLDGRKLKPAKVQKINKDQLQFILIEGRKRQIRRMCELVELEVLALKRVRIGGLKLGHLPKGKWRYLLPDERI